MTGAPVGRLQTVLDAARAGQSVVVSGPPASGVSALLRGFVAAASDLALEFDPTAPDPPDCERPTVLVVDDAHELGEEVGAQLGRRLLSGRLVAVLGATATSSVVARLRSTGGALTVELGPLSDEAIAEVVAEVLGAVPDRVTTGVLAADSGGLPGLLVPTVEAAATDGSMAVVAGIARLRGPLPLAPAVEDRLARQRTDLDSYAQRVLEAVSVGRELPARESVATFGLEALGACERAGLIEVVHRARVVRPAADVIARAVRAELGSFGVARVASSLLDELPGAPTERRVHWRLLAGEESEPSELLAAAASAHERGDLSLAGELSDHARRDGEPRAALLFAEVTAAVGDRAIAALVLEELLEQDGLEPDIHAGAALELATLSLWNLGQPDRAIGLAEEVARLTESTPFEGVGRGALGAMLAYSGRCTEALTVVSPSLEGDGPGSMLSCQVAATSLAVLGAGERAVAVGRRGLELRAVSPPAPGDVDPEIHVVSLALALEVCGRLAEGDRLTAEWYERAAHRSVHHAWIALARSRIMLVTGQLPAAALHAREAAAIFGDLDNHAPRRWALAADLLASAQLGERATVVARREELDALGPSGVTFLDSEIARAQIWADATVGHLDRARHDMAMTARAAQQDELYALAANAWHDSIRLGGNAGSASQLLSLEGKVEGHLMCARALHAGAVLEDRSEGLIEAARSYADLGALLFAAEAAAQAATLAERQKDRATHRTAIGLLRELSAGCSVAATPLLVEVPVAELSPRERDVARLAASGLTSREIGERLDLSVRTVDNLLQRTYLKLGVSGRRELRHVLDPDTTGSIRRE